jgi:hypothetical protein
LLQNAWRASSEGTPLFPCAHTLGPSA